MTQNADYGDPAHILQLRCEYGHPCLIPARAEDLDRCAFCPWRVQPPHIDGSGASSERVGQEET